MVFYQGMDTSKSQTGIEEISLGHDDEWVQRDQYIQSRVNSE